MSKKMFINATAEESRVAIVSKGVLEDLHVESVESGRIQGNIYKGTIVRVEKALQACFVDFGGARNGFLSLNDVNKRWWRKKALDSKRPRIEDALQSGMQLMVQVTREPEGRKGALLTTQISLPGRFVVLIPDSTKSPGISRKIENETQRKRLKDLAVKLAETKGHSFIIRTVGIDRTKAELERDIGYLDRLWQNIQTNFKKRLKAGCVFLEQDVVVRCVRDYFTTDTEEVLIDDAEAFSRTMEYVRAAMPRQHRRFCRYQGAQPIFARFGIEPQIEETFRNKVRLPSGGEIVIDRAEALVAVDVNSARSMGAKSMEDTAVRTNCEAATELARQLRLRDLGGLIVIDFIDLRESKNRRKVEGTLKKAMKSDKARHKLGRISEFGLLEMSRQRLAGPAAASSHESCAVCNGLGIVRSAASGARAAIRQVRSLITDLHVVAVHATLPGEIALALLNDKRAILTSIEEDDGVQVTVVPADLPRDDAGIFKTERADKPRSTTPDEVEVLRPTEDELAADDQDQTSLLGPLDEPAGATAEDSAEGEVQEATEERKPARRRRRRRRRSGSRAASEKAAAAEEGEKNEGAASDKESPSKPAADEQPDSKEQSAKADDEPASDSASDGTTRRRRRRRRRRRSGAAAPEQEGSSEEKAASAPKQAEKPKAAEARADKSTPKTSSSTVETKAAASGKADTADAAGGRPRRRRRANRPQSVLEAGPRKAQSAKASGPPAD